MENHGNFTELPLVLLIVTDKDRRLIFGHSVQARKRVKLTSDLIYFTGEGFSSLMDRGLETPVFIRLLAQHETSSNVQRTESWRGVE